MLIIGMWIFICLQENGPTRDGKRGKPLYDIPYMFEAREFLRKKLIGKKVNCFSRSHHQL